MIAPQLVYGKHRIVHENGRVDSWFMGGGFPYLCSHGMECLSDTAHRNDWLDGFRIRIRQELGTEMKETRKRGIFVFGFVYLLQSLPFLACYRYVTRETCI
jgi:hypothetical protein